MKKTQWVIKNISLLLLSALWMGPALAEGEKPPQKAKAPMPPMSLIPEETLAEIKSLLTNLKSKVAGFDNIYEKHGLGPQNVLGQTHLKNGKETYKKTEFRATIYNLNNYLNQTQVPDLQDYLDAQFLLGQSYYEVGAPEKSKRAYIRYLSTLATNPKYLTSRAVDVMGYLLYIVEQNPGRLNARLNETLTALTTLDMPPAQKAWTYFYAGKSARLSGNQKLALHWLALSFEHSTSDHLSARALYNRSLVLIEQKKFRAAMKDLKKALATTSTDSEEFHNLVLLSQARLNVHLKKPRTAIKTYEYIDPESNAYEEGLFEKIYVYVSLEDHEEAIMAAEEYLKRYPQSNNAYQVRTLRAFLDLRNGDIHNASINLKLSTERLTAISQWLQDNYGDRHTLTSRDISGLIRVTQGDIPHPPIVRQSQKLFHRISGLQDRLAKLRNDIRHTVFTLGAADKTSTFPQAHQRIQQLKELFIELFAAGDRLTVAERTIFRLRIKHKDAYALGASRQRRLRNFTPQADFSRGRGPWDKWSFLGNVTTRINYKLEKLKDTQAQLSALNFLSTTAKVRRPQARRSELAELTRLTGIMESELLRAMEVTRSRQALALLGMSDLYLVKNSAKDYADNILEERSILSAYRNNFKTAQEKHMSDDINAAWDIFEFLLKSLYKQLITIEHKMLNTIKMRLTILDEYTDVYDALHKNLAEKEQLLTRTLGKQLGYILEHYQNRIEARQSRHQKWQADLKWLGFELTSHKKHQVIEKYELEQQILRENLKDLYQGVLWKWPSSKQSL